MSINKSPPIFFVLVFKNQSTWNIIVKISELIFFKLLCLSIITYFIIWSLMNYIYVITNKKKYESIHTKIGAMSKKNSFQKWSAHKKEQIIQRSQEKTKFVEPQTFRFLPFPSVKYLRNITVKSYMTKGPKTHS